MPNDRRSFLEELLAAAAVSSLIAPEASAQAQAKKQGAASPGGHDSISFWNQFYDTQTRAGGQPKLAAPERQARFLYHGSSGFHYPTEIPKDALLDHEGDVSATISVGQFHPSKTDRTAFNQLQSATFRVDCVQTRPMMNLVAPLAWAALASLFPDKQGKLPSLQSLGFQNTDSTGSQSSTVFLPGGVGKLAVNISMVHKESIVHKILTEAQSIAGITAPFFAFPAISIPALKALTSIYSALEQHADFLLNSPLTMAVATQQGLADESNDVQVLPLATGDYVLVPQAHTDELSKHLDNLVMTSGYLVQKDAPTNQPIETRAANAIPDVTYVTLKVSVKAATAASPAKADAPAPAADSSDSSKGSASKPPAKSGGSSSTPPKKKQ